MKPYSSMEEMIAILNDLWERIFNTPGIVKSVSGVKLVARFKYTDYNCSLYIDLSGETPAFFWDREVDVDVDMLLSSETSHLFWMQKLNVPLALASRKIIAKGSVQKSLKLIPALKPAFALYPDVLRSAGRHDLLSGPVRVKRKRSRALFRKTRSTEIRMDRVPAFPLELAGPGTREKEAVIETGRENVTPADILGTMYRIRFFEEHLSRAFRNGDLPTEAIHLSLGQEGVAAGVCLNLRGSDCLNTTHRGHGHIIAKGADLNRMMAEIYGRSHGQCRGKGGSMHVTDGSRGILGANGIVGAGYLLAMGAGFTIKQQSRDDVSVIIAGDGSVNQGMFHEAMNMISLFSLPVLVIIENNLYGEFTSVENHSAVTELYRRAEAYNIESLRIDGNDVNAVFRETGEIINKIRSDSRPRLIELLTYRWHGHMEGEPELYRSDEEKEEYRKKDPLLRYRNSLIQDEIMSPSGADRVMKEAEYAVAEAVDFAVASPLPEIGTLLSDVYTPEPRVLFTGDIPESPGGREISVAQAVNRALSEEMAADDRVFLWGEDVTLGGYFNVTEGLVQEFGPGRIIDTPISENAIVGGAVGAAMTGLRPVAEILFSDFLACCMDPILNQAAKLKYMTGGQVSIPLTMRAPLGSGIGMAAQHSQSMERFFYGIPGLIVAAPSDPYTATGILKSAIRSDNPVLVFEHKLLYPVTGKVPDTEYTLPLGKARVARQGRDITIVTWLLGVSAACDAADILAAKGIEAEVIDLVTLYPMDTEGILRSVGKTGYLVTLEEGSATGGVGAEIITRVSTAGFGLLKAAPLRVAAPECPIPYAKNLENAMMPDPEALARSIEDLL